ncbi:MAG: DGC domain protein [candidate division BRC1 bacterium ADurb.BinA364]|nr:MAG: DGC domain protein [candidate division BRC1 bacterium ADurb.BinA364]
MSQSESSACCSGAPKLIFACSGAADVGAIADQAARKLTREGLGKMYCLAGVGGRIETIVETTRQASRILAIDGCPTDCVKATLEGAGFANFAHVRITDLGMDKGKTPPTEQTIAAAANAAASRLA